MASNINNKKRMEKDVTKLIMSEYEVLLKDENKMDEFTVVFYGPRDSPYEAGVWKVNVLLPDHYPYKSPSIGFLNKVYHPNIDEASGSVCLDVINQTWSPMYDLKNIFDVFLPQLLMYPNPSDPLNGTAAKLLLLDSQKYEIAVREHVEKHAKNPKFKETIISENDNLKNTSNNITNTNLSTDLEGKCERSLHKKSLQAEGLDELGVEDRISEISAASFNLDDEVSDL